MLKIKVMSIFGLNLLNMNTYSMSQVEMLTGIKSHTLRIWERRYSFLKPERTDTNIRYYSDSEVRKLLNVSILLNNGYRVSAIDKLKEDEIHALILELNSRSSAKFDDDLNRLVLSMIELDEEKFTSVFQRHVTRNGLLSTVMELLYPFLDHVGILWMSSRTIPAQEHFISNIIRQKIVTAIDMIPSPRSDSKKVIMFLPENENHEIGLLLANYIAKDLGFKVYYLGQNVPIVNIVDVHEIVNSDLLFTMFVTPTTDEYLKSFELVLTDIPKPLLIAGNYVSETSPNNFSYITSPEKLLEKLTQLREDN